MTRSRIFFASLILFLLPFTGRAEVMLPGLSAPTKVVRDSNGIPHIYARNQHDLFYMQGRIHAEDRLFQMDVTRRSAAGTLAELFGEAALPSDVETRTIGLARAAERSLAAHSPEMKAILQAYADGVNSYLDEIEPAGKLPPEYAGLYLDQVKRWQPLDSVLAGKALASITSLIIADDIELDVALQAYLEIEKATMGAIDGQKLFAEDLFRNAPFDPASTVPDAQNGFAKPAHEGRPGGKWKRLKPETRAKVLEQGRAYIERIRKLRKIPGALHFDGDDMGGSNSWVVSGRHTPSRRPLLANDIHLALQNPAIFHELELTAPGIKVTGHSLAGAPCVVRGHNRNIAWGVTNARLDITEVYSEVIVPVSPTELFTQHLDRDGNVVLEAVEVVSEQFNVNVFGSGVHPAFERDVFIVPRRNNGPLITEPEYDPANEVFTALSVQSVGFGPTRDPEGLCAISKARNLEEFKAGLQLIDFASQNFTYADTRGNIGYFISGEVPLREDLQGYTADNLPDEIAPPFLIRSGFAGNEWVALDGDIPAKQATPYQILPFDEMPQILNPRSGIIVNANNDQAGNTLDNNPLNDFRQGGQGLRYLNWGGRNFSIRAGRVTEMINQRLNEGYGRLNFFAMKNMQADTVMNDARVLAPYIMQAYDNATGDGAHPALAPFAADPRLAEAVERLRSWNFTTPTGIAEGYDGDPAATDPEASVAATIYSVWRGEMVANSIDVTLDAYGIPDAIKPKRREEVVTALKHLLERDGIGASGMDFFNLMLPEASLRRDALVLASLSGALDLLASDAFAEAFNESTDQDDYRWGKVHLATFVHPLGGLLNQPPSVPGVLSGFPIDGGFETVDEAPPGASNVRVSGSDSLLTEFGPSGRFVAWAGPFRIRAETSLPGGNSAIPGSPFYQNLLVPYLNNETFPLLTSPFAVKRDAVSSDRFVPASP